MVLGYYYIWCCNITIYGFVLRYEMCQEGYIDDLTKNISSAQLTLRRGQDFTVKIELDRDYDPADHLRVISSYGRFINMIYKLTLVKSVFIVIKQYSTGITILNADLNSVLQFFWSCVH